MMPLALLVVGCLVVVKSAEWLIGNARTLGKRFGLSDLFLGLTVVAIGTSAPELAVNVISGLKQLPGLQVGNILGSNLANLLLILGIAAASRKIAIHPAVVRIGLPLNIIASSFVVVLVIERLTPFGGMRELSRGDGLLLLFGFPLYAFYTLNVARVVNAGENLPRRDLGRAIAGLAAGIIGLAVGADWIVQGATGIARAIGVSEHVIGFTAVAIGTSLPELAITLTGLLKRTPQLVVGNLVGSNLFNTFLILGVSAVMRPLPFDRIQLEDAVAVAAATAIVWMSIAVLRHPVISRPHGLTFIVLYLGYLGISFFRAIL